MIECPWIKLTTNQISLAATISADDLHEAFHGLFVYITRGRLSEMSSDDANDLYQSLIQSVDICDESYKKKAAINRKNGNNGGRPRKTDSETQPETQSVFDSVDRVSDGVTDRQIDGVIDKESEGKKPYGILSNVYLTDEEYERLSYGLGKTFNVRLNYLSHLINEGKVTGGDHYNRLIAVAESKGDKYDGSAWEYYKEDEFDTLKLWRESKQ